MSVSLKINVLKAWGVENLGSNNILDKKEELNRFNEISNIIKDYGLDQTTFDGKAGFSYEELVYIAIGLVLSKVNVDKKIKDFVNAIPENQIDIILIKIGQKFVMSKLLQDNVLDKETLSDIAYNSESYIQNKYGSKEEINNARIEGVKEFFDETKIKGMNSSLRNTFKIPSLTYDKKNWELLYAYFASLDETGKGDTKKLEEYMVQLNQQMFKIVNDTIMPDGKEYSIDLTDQINTYKAIIDLMKYMNCNDDKNKIVTVFNENIEKMFSYFAKRAVKENNYNDVERMVSLYLLLGDNDNHSLHKQLPGVRFIVRDAVRKEWNLTTDEKVELFLKSLEESKNKAVIESILYAKNPSEAYTNITIGYKE